MKDHEHPDVNPESAPKMLYSFKQEGKNYRTYTVLIALCNTEVKTQIKALPEYKEFDQKLDSMMLLKAIKKILYTGGSNNLHAKHIKAMAHISFMTRKVSGYTGNKRPVPGPP